MNARQHPRCRCGRYHHESVVTAAVLLVVGLVVVKWLAGSNWSEGPSLWSWEGALGAAFVCLSVLGLVIGLILVAFLVFSAWFLFDLAKAPTPAARKAVINDFCLFAFLCLSAVLMLLLLLPVLVLFVPLWLIALGVEGVAWYRRTRTEKRLAALRTMAQGGGTGANAGHLQQAVKLLGNRDEGVRQQALQTAACLLRANPSLAASASARARIRQALREQIGFLRALEESGAAAPLPALVTLGAKVGAGTIEKRISPATSDPARLARWLFEAKDDARPQEVQVSIGYDCGPLPSQVERGKFLALYLFVACTDLKRFQALARQPARDPNAAYGLLIRGDRVEVHYPGQACGRRLDYVFPLPSGLSEANLAEFLRQLQLLNLGMLLASAEESYRSCFPGEAPPGMDARTRAIAHAYRGFERKLVALLRRHDAHRDPDQVYPLEPADHAERQAALRTHRLEECLYPRYGWVVPLYGEDTSWDRLLPVLRAVEAMMLHQGSVEGQAVTRGQAFIRAVRLLGYETAAAIEEALARPDAQAPAATFLDPFIDAGHEAATTAYLRAMTRAIQKGEVSREALPDPTTFRTASAYYRVEEAGVPA